MTGNSDYKLVLSQVSKRYGTFDALKKVDLSIRSGEFVTLLGPSGSGKSTLLKIIAGMTQSTTGQVVIDGRDATNMPSRKRDLGMVFQNYALIPHMTVFENVAFPLRVRRMSNAEIGRKVAEALDIVQLNHFADRRPAALSGGQQQRVSIARAIVYGPSLVLMDEPLGALDKKLREQLQVEIRQLHKSLGITILYVTHDQQEAMSMSDRIVLMNEGDIEQIAAPQELYFAPRTRFAADFIGDSNFMDGVSQEASGGYSSFRLATGERISAPLESALPPGKSAAIMVRPEHIMPMAVEDAAAHKQSGDWNCISAVAFEMVFLGGNIQLRATRPDASKISSVVANDNSGKSYAPGSELMLAWRPHHTIVFAK